MGFAWFSGHIPKLSPFASFDPGKQKPPDFFKFTLRPSLTKRGVAKESWRGEKNTDRFSILLALLDLDLPQHWKVTTKWPSSNFKWLHWYHILSAVWTTVIAVGCQCTPRLRPVRSDAPKAVAFCGGQDDPRRDDAQNGNVEETVGHGIDGP